MKFNLDSLEHRHKVSGLCQIYRMVSGVAPSKVCELLPPYDAKNRDSRLTENSHHFQLTINKSRTTSHMRSFIPYYVRRWNEVPVECMYDRHGDLAGMQAFKVSINRWLCSA